MPVRAAAQPVLVRPLAAKTNEALPYIGPATVGKFQNDKTGEGCGWLRQCRDRRKFERRGSWRIAVEDNWRVQQQKWIAKIYLAFKVLNQASPGRS